MGFELKGMQPLENKFQRLSHARFDAVIEKNMTEIYNRGKQNSKVGGQGTPVSTEETRPGGPHGELRESLSQHGDEVGYTKDYAAHVEYGHRTTNGGFVKGQRFLQKNVDEQRKTYKKDLIEQLKKA